MISGHPFLTEEFDRLRSKQRNVLASMPIWILEKALPEALSAETLPSLPDRTETALRELAMRFIDEAHQLVADAHQVAVAEAALGAIRSTSTAGTDDLNDLRQQLEGQRLFPKLTDLHYNADVLASMKVMIPLLVWADQIAGDYTDPRVSDLRK